MQPNKRAQVSVEFMLNIIFVALFCVAFMTIISYQMIDFNEMNDRKQVNDFGDSLKKRLTLRPLLGAAMSGK